VKGWYEYILISLLPLIKRETQLLVWKNVIHITDLEKMKHPCAECAEMWHKNWIVHIEQKILTAIGCVKKIHSTAIMWAMRALKNKHQQENQLKVLQKESGKTFCEKCIAVEKYKNAVYLHRYALVWKSSNALVFNSSTVFCLSINFHLGVLHFLVKVMKYSLLIIWYFCIPYNIKPK